jgi:peptidoglycan/xylan/chitin deacetylase (PgdA/CDA1 family)
MNLPFRGSPVTILMYHSVHPQPDAYAVTPSRFREHIALVKRLYPVVALKDVHAHLGDNGNRRIIITFDDAFEDFLEHAYPTLVEFNVPATLFVPTGFVGRFNDWDSHMPHVTRKRIMDIHALRRVAADGLVDLGSHTVDHACMRRLARAEMQAQASSSKQWLEDTFGRSITMFSYPYGQRDHFSGLTERVLAENNYTTAVTTCWGTRNSRRQTLSLRRIHFANDETLTKVRAKIEGLYDWVGLKEQAGFGWRSGMRLIGREI